MISKLETKPSVQVLFFIVVAAFAFNVYASRILNESYAQSLFPVPYYEAQLSFSAEKLKGWYGFLIENGTLDVYVRTQHIDFLFILSVLLLHVSALLLISRLFKKGGRWRRAMIYCALLAALAPAADAAENAVSYIMLANPLGFPGWLALIYSSFAALKFAMFTFAYIAAAIGLVAGIFCFLKNSFVGRA
jgi:hypothetical protein